MTLDKFRELAAIWGGDIARWPERLRADAATVARNEPEAAGILAEAASFDRFMENAAPVVTDHRAAEAIHAVVTRLAATGDRRARRPLSTLHRWLAPAAGFAAAAAVGISLGMAYPAAHEPETSVAGAALVAIIVNDSVMLPGTE
jgi:hypothetical protein